MSKRFQLGLALSALTLSMGSVSAQVLFPQPQAFVLDRACDAVSSIKKQSNTQALAAGQSFTALGTNREPNPSHAYLQLGSEKKWIELSCGHFTNAAVANPATSQPTPSAASNCLPFFDTLSNPVKLKSGLADITPPAPAIDAFGHAVNKVCGPAGNHVDPEEFKQLMRANPEVLQRVKSFTQDKVFANRPARASVDEYLNDLTEAWFAVRAFNHIFCGEPEANGPIGGLHYVGRYVQLQQTGEACRMDNYRQNEVVPGVLYSMGATMRFGNNTARSSIKGYGLTLSAEDLIKVGTRAFAENPTDSRDKTTACLVPIQDDGYKFTAVFARRSAGIRTLYPDATPSATDPACKSAISLN
jgi:hypothetical protein